MKRSVVVTISVVLIGSLIPLPAYAAEQTLQQWIAPLECTESRIVNGSSVTTILTPEECDDLLNPKPPVKPQPEIPDVPKTPSTPRTPGAPDTGYFKDPGPGMLLFLVLAGLIILVARRKRKH